MTITHLASTRVSGPIGIDANLGRGGVSNRKIYVGNVPLDVSSDMLLGNFLSYGEIEVRPLGFDKKTGEVEGVCVFCVQEGGRSQGFAC